MLARDVKLQLQNQQGTRILRGGTALFAPSPLAMALYLCTHTQWQDFNETYHVHHVNGYCWKGFRGQWSKVKAMASALLWWRHTFRRC